MDYLKLTLLSSALSLDDLALAVALCLLIPRETLINRIMHSTKLALAFAIPNCSITVIRLVGECGTL
jgi:hypothetical protein